MTHATLLEAKYHAQAALARQSGGTVAAYARLCEEIAQSAARRLRLTLRPALAEEKPNDRPVPPNDALPRTTAFPDLPVED